MAKAKKSAVTKGKASASKGTATAARATSAAAVATPASVRAELAKLGKAALQKKFKEVFGRAPKSDNVHHLREALAKKLVPERSETTKAAGTEAKAARPAKERDPRLPVAGTLIKRPYKGVTHEVKVLDDAFEYGGERHRSLSAIAKSITGQQTNGFLWFGLIPREGKTTVTTGDAPQPAEKRPAKKQARG